MIKNTTQLLDIVRWIDRSTLELKDLINDLVKKGKKIAGYGAAAKGMTILKCSDVGNKLSYFVDDSPAKQATPASYKSLSANSLLVIPVPSTLGNA